MEDGCDSSSSPAVDSAPDTPTTPHSSTNLDEATFKSNLQVFLKRQDEELIKNKEFMEKMEQNKKENDDRSPEDKEKGDEAHKHDEEVGESKEEKEDIAKKEKKEKSDDKKENTEKEEKSNDSSNKDKVKEKNEKSNVDKRGYHKKDRNQERRKDSEENTEEKHRNSDHENDNQKRVKKKERVKESLKEKEEKPHSKVKKEEGGVKDKTKSEIEEKASKDIGDGTEEKTQDKREKRDRKEKEDEEKDGEKDKRKKKEHKEKIDHKEKTEKMGKKEGKEKTEQKEEKKTEYKEKKEDTEKEHKEKTEHKEKKEDTEKEHKEKTKHKEKKEDTEKKEHKEKTEHKEKKEHKEKTEHREKKEDTEKEHKEKPEHKEKKEDTEKEHKEKTEHKEKKEDTEKKEHKEKTEHKEKKEDTEKKKRKEKNEDKDKKKHKEKEEQKEKKEQKVKKEKEMKNSPSTKWKKEVEEIKRPKEKEASKEVKSQGFLCIKKGPFSSWKRYYFVLDGRLLTYYRSQHDYEKLSGLKGSLDLALLENVRLTKPGIMKTHFPFHLSRRNLSSMNLAADTSEEREKWLKILEDILQRPQRLSSSDNTLEITSSCGATKQLAKSATLPGRPKASGSSDDEDDDDDDELKLIKPKKVPRVPIAGPLMGVNISQVKLKKVETKMKEVSDDVASSSLHQEDDEPKKELMLPSGGEFGVFKLKKIERSKEDKEEVGDADISNEEEDKTKPAGELFGVKLKTIQSKDEVIKHDVAESKKEDVGATQKRHNKQPKIPLNNSALLNRSEISSPKTSPINQKKGTTERKKSPSPSIPLSKSVHALTKSVEEVSVTNDEAFCEPSKKDDTEETITKHVTIHHAKSIELKYSDNVENMESDPVMEVTFIEKEENMPEIQIEEYNDDEKLDIPSNQDQEGPDDFETIPQVSVVVKDDSDEEPEYEEFDEEFLRNMKQVAYASLPLEKQVKDDDNDEEDEEYDYEEYNEDFRKNITSIAYNPTLAPSQLHSPIVTKSTPSPIQSTSQASISPLPPIPRDPSSSSEDDEEHAYEEFDESFLQHVKSSYMKTAGEPATSGALKAPEDGVTPPRSPFRGRTSTNESTTSSKSDAENVEKKSGKFKFFRNKRSGSIGSADMKEVEVPKASKEKKKKGITIPKILSGKKGRDKHKKSSDETDAKPEMHKDSYQQSHEASKSIPEKKPETVEGETIQDAVEKKNSNEIIPENETDHPRGDENSDLQVDSSLSIGSEPTEEVPVVMRRDLPLLNTESRYSSTSWASNSSRDHDPAPSVPEKTRVRAKSPNHDIPQSNRPVTNFYQPSQPQEHETEDRKPVDGYISQEQIDAILSANETRDKKRLSQSRALVNLLTVPDGSKTAGRSDNAEEFISKRPSYVSNSSMESDEPLPTTNFISGDRRSSSLGSLKDRSKSCESDSSGEFHQQVENASPEQGDTSTVPLGKNSRLTESFAAGNRISLTSPEFTVVEEDGPGTPDATNIFFPDDKEQEPPHSSVGNKPTTPMGDEEDEQKDYFPTVGRDVELRKLPANLTLLDSSRDNVRTSGIVGLKECLKQMGDEEEVMEVKTGISRLGHSAAVEKLKKSFEEL